MSCLDQKFVDILASHRENINIKYHIKHLFDLNQKTQDILCLYKIYIEVQRCLTNDNFFADLQINRFFNSDINQSFENNYLLDLTEDLPVTSENPDKYIGSNIIILRDYTNQKKLFGCCGHGKQQSECGYILDEHEREAYRSNHNHGNSDYYTIDQCISVAPDCI